ncbi:hypothetical protein MAPG_10583 [Magnaporthiopsis poae ATCC 64411]|uniref:C2H2-type domain-containing protein n=1 Tax=Magnaporthiopsis poae (strain ATCC 64411 / 73-15) TaxID=644358 RepID=A0A0C4ECZ4_MAGP6|nr:hypothetical protein MAPG_10583 [Magnaporthiopsis poae ATCC 64411]
MTSTFPPKNHQYPWYSTDAGGSHPVSHHQTPTAAGDRTSNHQTTPAAEMTPTPKPPVRQHHGLMSLGILCEPDAASGAAPPASEPGCGKVFDVRSRVERHLKTHRKAAEPTVPVAELTCPLPGCDRVFEVPSGLTRHLQIHLREHPCSYCGKGFATQSDVRKHEACHRRGSIPLFPRLGCVAASSTSLIYAFL